MIFEVLKNMAITSYTCSKRKIRLVIAALYFNKYEQNERWFINRNNDGIDNNYKEKRTKESY